MLTNHLGTESQDLAKRLTNLGVPVLDGTVVGLLAVRHARAYRDFTLRPVIAPPRAPAPEVSSRWRARLTQGTVLTESEGLDLLSDYGVPAVPHRRVRSEQAALEAAEEFGYPVVLKTAAPGVLHKSEVSGVALNLTDSYAVRAAYADLSARLGVEALIAPMAPPEVEMALGVVFDPQFGSMVLVAGGGILIEVLGDRQLGLAPIDTAIAAKMIEKLAIKPVLDGIRGRPPVDIASVVAALVALSDLAADLGDLIAELDVNPLAVTSSGCLALDALVIPHDHRSSS